MMSMMSMISVMSVMFVMFLTLRPLLAKRLSIKLISILIFLGLSVADGPQSDLAAILASSGHAPTIPLPSSPPCGLILVGCLSFGAPAASGTWLPSKDFCGIPILLSRR